MLRAWSWAQLDVSKLIDIIAHIRKALNPDAHVPGRVDMSLHCQSLFLDFGDLRHAQNHVVKNIGRMNPVWIMDACDEATHVDSIS
jgi:hypothetical protein